MKFFLGIYNKYEFSVIAFNRYIAIFFNVIKCMRKFFRFLAGMKVSAVFFGLEANLFSKSSRL